MNRITPVVLGFAVLAASIFGAAAGNADSSGQCSRPLGVDVSSDQRISACTAMIDSGTLATADLALALARRGEGYFAGKRYDETILDLDRALELNGKNMPAQLASMIYVDKGSTYLALARPARAGQDFNRAVAFDSRFANAFYGRGVAYFLMGAAARGREDFDSALTLQPNYVDAYVGRGMADYAMGDIPHAIQELGYAILLKPDAGIAYYYRGLAYLGAGQFDLAVPDLDRALALKIDNAAASMRDRVKAANDAWSARLAVETPSVPGVPPADGILPARAVGRSHDCSAMYPDISRHLFESGDVMVGYDLDAVGAIANVTLLRPSGSERLDRAALACVGALWRNTPASRNGQPISSPGHQAIIRFSVPPLNSAKDYDTRAEGLTIVGQYALALACINHAIALDDKSPGFFYRRGFIEYLMGDYATAIADYTVDIDLKHGDAKATDALDLARAAQSAAAHPPVAGHGI
ncbi:MAG TPA: TonB family protein [Rhizomicrobium sp.]